MEFTAEEFENAQIKAYQRTKDQFQIDGFRKGKAPPEALSKALRRGSLLRRGDRRAFSTSITERALAELELEVIDSPAAEFSKIAKGEGFTATITVLAIL